VMGDLDRLRVPLLAAVGADVGEIAQGVGAVVLVRAELAARRAAILNRGLDVGGQLLALGRGGLSGWHEAQGPQVDRDAQAFCWFPSRDGWLVLLRPVRSAATGGWLAPAAPVLPGGVHGSRQAQGVRMSDNELAPEVMARIREAARWQRCASCYFAPCRQTSAGCIGPVPWRAGEVPEVRVQAVPAKKRGKR
jgi:hypothetical protein